MPTHSYFHPFTMLVMGLALLGCSESAPVVASMSASTMLAKTTEAPPAAPSAAQSAVSPPANAKNAVAATPGSVVIERCREADVTTGKCVDAMCVSYIGKGVWSEHFECVP